MESVQRELLIMISTPLYAVLIGLEIILSKIHGHKYYTLKDTITNLSFMILASGIELLMIGIYFFVLYFFYEHRLFEINNIYTYWLVLLITEDFFFYWLHYLEHHSRLFWAVHSTHHSSEQFNLTVGFRSSVFQPLYRFIFFIPLALIGFKPADIIFIYSATQIWGILVHTEYIKKLGFLEKILSTPSNHRVHHASNTKYLDKNIGMVFILWDQIFKTYIKEDLHEPTKYGLTTKIPDKPVYNLVLYEWKQILEDLKKDLPFAVKIKYLFAAPGWSHDGSRKTSKQLQKELEN